jgi:isorenieratene synthase
MEPNREPATHSPLGPVIVGGGIAGMCAAVSLADRGLRPLLLERDGYSFGGRVAARPPTAFEHAGHHYRFSLEHGMHGWWRQYRNFLALLDRQGLSDQLIDAYDQTLMFDDGVEVYRTNVGRETQITPVFEPIHHAQLLRKQNIRRLISLREVPQLATLALRVLEAIRFDPYDSAHLHHYDQLSVADFTAGMPRFFQAFLRSLTRSGFFSDPPKVSLWAFLLSLQLYVFLRKDSQCFSFARGPIMERLFAPLLRKIEAAGGELERGVEVTAIERRPEGGFWVEWSRTAGAEPPSDATTLKGSTGRLAAPELILAVDVSAAKRLVATSPCLAPILGRLESFAGRPSTNIRLWWSRGPDNRWGESGVFGGKSTADNYFWLHRFQDEFAAWHQATGGGVSESHIYAPLSLHDLTDDELLDRVERDMARAFPEIAGSAVHRTIVRNRASHINFPVGCATAFPKVETALEELALCGDWIDGGIPVLYMERACQTGIAAANVMLRRRGREPWPILQPVPPPPHIRALQAGLRALEPGLRGLGTTQPSSWRAKATGGS